MGPDEEPAVLLTKERAERKAAVDDDIEIMIESFLRV